MRLWDLYGDDHLDWEWEYRCQKGDLDLNCKLNRDLNRENCRFDQDWDRDQNHDRLEILLTEIGEIYAWILKIDEVGMWIFM